MNLGEKQKLDLTDAGKKKAAKVDPSTPKPNTVEARSQFNPLHGRQRNEPEATEEDDDEEEDDEIISTVKSKEGLSKNTMRNSIILIAIAVTVIVVFLLFFVQSARNKQRQDAPSTIGEPVIEESLSPESLDADEEDGEVNTEEPQSTKPTIGIQDFREDTNNKTTPTLTPPAEFTKDLYGLTTRVDYEVTSIESVIDNVSYTKKRGTWGEGLELYWLDASYQGRTYVVQVPFEYYKELTDVGIVPVKLEVLRIAEPTTGKERTIVSYMKLDEETLQTILDSQH